MKEQLISFEVAKLAKEKGFEIETFTAYIGGVFFESEGKPNGYDGWDLPNSDNWNKKDWVFDKEGYSYFGCNLDNIKYFEACSAPTQSLLQKWLRETKDFHIIVGSSNIKGYNFCVSNEKGLTGFSAKTFPYETYEEALENALFEILDLM